MSKDQNIDWWTLFANVARIRAFEKLLLEEFKFGNIRGTIHTSIGQEYAPVILSQLAGNAFWFSNHRGHAHFLAKTQDFAGLFAEILGYEGAICGGVGGSQHLFAPQSFMSNGIQGGQLGIAAGISSKHSGHDITSVFFMGDGTTGAGHIYEALNLAKLHDSKLLVILEDNEIAQSTPTVKTIAGDLGIRFAGFGIEYHFWSPANIDVKKDLEELNQVLRNAIKSVENGVPTLVQVKSSRLAPHSKGDDNRDEETLKNLESRDFLNRAMAEGIFSNGSEQYEEIRAILNLVKCRNQIKLNNKTSNSTTSKDFKESKTRILGSKLKLKDSINFALRNSIEKFETNLIGEDIEDFPISEGGQYGGAFKVTAGLSRDFPNEVENFPISESGMLGFALGKAMSGQNTIVEIMFSDFLSQGLDQVIHQISKLQTIYGRTLEIPLLIRTASGPGKGYGPTHSHTLETQLVGLPNIEVLSANPFVPYLEIIEEWVRTKKCFIVFEPKELYLNSAEDFSSSMFEVVLPQTIYGPVKISPKHVQSDITILIYGSAIWKIVKELETLLYEMEIAAEVIIPTVISNWEAEDLYKSLENNGGRLLLITDNLNSNGFQDEVVIEAFNRKKLNKVISINYENWIPNGILEDEIMLDNKLLKERIQRLMKQ